MAQRKGHGRGAGVPRIEVLPADELPVGVPAPTRQEAPRDASGRLLAGPGTRALAAKAGQASALSRQLGRLLGLATMDETHPYAPYAKLAREFRDAHMANLAANVGGGEIGPGVASIVSTAALQLSASRYLADKGAQEGDAKTLLEASRLADASRQNLLAAHELAAKEATSRRDQSGPDDPLDKWMEPKK